VIVVSNATPLITLALLGQFDLLGKLFTELIISKEVWTEVVAKGAGRPGAPETSRATWIRVVKVADRTQLSTWLSTYNLGAGELSTILLAKELSASLALIDDLKARRLAVTEGVTLGSSISCLELGYRRGHFNDLRQLYVQLLSSNIRITREILNRSLATLNLPRL